MTAIERVIATAKSQIGYLEKKTNDQLEDFTANAGYNNWNKFAAFLDNLGVVYNGKKNGYSWCDIFVDYCFIYTFGLELGMEMTFQPYKGYGAGCTNSMQYYKKNDAFYNTPQAGDQIFYTKDGGKTSYHTGLVYNVDSTYVYTIEGNTSTSAGVVPNGGCVAAKVYKRSSRYIAGYGRPDWSLIKEDDDTMTQDDFNKMFAVAMAAYEAEMQDNDAANWSDAARRFMVDNGLISGIGKDENGKNIYAWEMNVTREQLSAIMYRAFENCLYQKDPEDYIPSEGEY